MDRKNANALHSRPAPTSLPSSADGAEADPRITHQSPDFSVPDNPAPGGKGSKGSTSGGHTFERAGRRFSD